MSKDVLKDALYTTLIDIVTNGVQIVDKESGEIVRVAAPAPYLAAAISLVKMDIEAGNPVPKSAHPVMQQMRNKLKPGVADALEKQAH